MLSKLKCTNAPCLSCSMNEQDTTTRRLRLAACFKEFHLKNDDDLLISLIGLWDIALAQPDDQELPKLGIFKCLAKLIDKCIKEKQWLFQGKNIYIPYYSAHIIGSYTMNKSQNAEIAVKSGVIWSLLELLRGKISWVEQRVAIRAFGHLATHKKTFDAISVHEEEIINHAMKIASTCLGTVYTEFLGSGRDKRPEYHADLMTKGLGSVKAEEKKAEEWASQLQCWSLYLLNCFAAKNRSIHLICKEDFLKDLCGMWGGLENQNSFSGVGLIRTLCHSEKGREVISNLEEIVIKLCNFSRSSDNWKLTAIDSLMLLLKDHNTRCKVINIAANFLVDLVELRSKSNRRIKIGDMITQVLLQDFSKIKYGELEMENERARNALEEVWDLKVERRKKNKIMSEQEARNAKILVKMLKQEGNQKFWSGDVQEAVEKYTNALDLCPLRLIKERIVLYSNRAQCYLLLKQPESAISDTTRALCLSGSANPHTKSLWRRSQAYDLAGLPRESLMDCKMFINERIKLKHKRHVKVPDYAVHMLNKQINATWLFRTAFAKSKADSEEAKQLSKVDDHVGNQKMLRRMDQIFIGISSKEGRKIKKGCIWRKQLQRISKTRKNCCIASPVPEKEVTKGNCN